MSCAGCWKCCILTCQNGKNTEESYSFARCCRVSFVQFCKWIPVWLLWMILAWSYYVYVYLLCIESTQDVKEKVGYLSVYHFLLFLLMWSYVRTIYTDISVIPNEFYLTDDQVTELRNETNWTTRKSMLQNLASTHEFQTSTKDGDARYCEKCQCLKPDRCHHCSICRTCVLKMDHHCPWTNNCVGFYNYKFFLLMVIYAVVWCTFVAATTARFTADIFMKNERMTYTQASIVILEFTSIAFVIVNVCLLVYHLCLIRHNTTTIETFFPPVFKNVGSHASFNWGCGYNFEQIFGKKKSLWFIPVFTSLGDGVKFPVARSVEDGSDVINEPSSVIAE